MIAPEPQDQAPAVEERRAAESLRARGLRMTRQRELIIEALRELEHATPDELTMAVSMRGGQRFSLSTAYRSLDVLEELGIVGRAHLDGRAPVYYLLTHADHLHLLCTSCGAVTEAEMDVAEPLARRLAEEAGFEADLRHLVVRGRCRECAAGRA